MTTLGMNWLFRQFPKLERPSYDFMPKKILYIPASSLPYHISGYTTRTHAVIRALRDAGSDVHVLTRPGYPWDRADRVAQPGDGETLVEGTAYSHARRPANNCHVLQFAFQASKVIADAAQKHRVAAIHAASNHTNALPALLAARKLGVPFHYEMRGLWELTRASRMAWFENSARYKLGLELEGLVAKHADRLFVISQELGRYVQENWGVQSERMALLPNCVDPETILPVDVTKAESNVIGYAGSIMPYEGLDTLVEAVALLAERGLDVRVKIVGDGEARSSLEELSRQMGQTTRIEFYGRQLPLRALEILESCSLVCIPRKPFQVCEIVPPIKLVEALAMAKPVIVPDLPVFRDELGSDPAGWFFRAGDPADLAGVIEKALCEPARLAGLGAKAREYVLSHRTWRRFVDRVLEPYDQGEAIPCSA